MFTMETVVSSLRSAGCVFAEDEARLLMASARSQGELADMIDRRITGIPLEQVLDWVEFYGLRIVVEPGVFVPRRRSELLVSEAASVAGRGSVVLDLCCGSGALGRALATAVRRAKVHSADIEPAATDCARHNLAEIGGRVYLGDLFDPLPDTLRGRVDILLCNAPYVPSERIITLPPEARVHEPRATLDGGHDGLDIVRRVAAEAPHWRTTRRRPGPAARLIRQCGAAPPHRPVTRARRHRRHRNLHHCPRLTQQRQRPR